MSIQFTTYDLIIARAVAHQASGCDLPTALDAEATVWRRHRRRHERRPLAPLEWLRLMEREIEIIGSKRSRFLRSSRM